MKRIYLICNGCGWIHFGVSLEHTLDEVKKFNEYYDALLPQKQQEYYGGKRLHVTDYCFCFSCGSLFTRMRKLTKNDHLPNGSTVSPIIDPRKAKYGPNPKNKSDSKQRRNTNRVRNRKVLSSNRPKRKD